MFQITDIKHDGVKYRFRFKCPVTGKSHARRGLDETALEKTRAALLADMMSGKYQARINAELEKEIRLATSLGTVLRDYVKEREADCARGDIQQSHLDQICGQLRRLRPLHEVDVADLTDNHFQDIIDALEGKCGPATPRTRQAYAVEFKRLQKWLRRKGHTKTEFGPLKTGQIRKKVLWVPEPEEVQRVIEAAQGQWRTMISLMATTGLRSGEVRALRWDAVDQKRRRITVQEAVKAKASGRPLEVGKPKRDASVRTIQISDALLKQLQELPKKSSLVFSRDDGDLISKEYFRHQMRKAIRASGVEWRGTPAHSFRHFACSLFMQEFSNPKKVQQLMGHASITVTMDIYTHLFKEDEDARDGNRIAGRLGL